VPTAPTGLRTLAIDGGAVLLWDESPEPWVRGYRIYRAGPDGEFTQIGESATPAYTDSASPTGARLSYRASAVGPGGEGPPSKAAAAPPREPANGPKK